MSIIPSNVTTEVPGKSSQTGDLFAKVMNEAAVRTQTGNTDKAAGEIADKASGNAGRVRKDIARLDKREISGKGEDKTGTAKIDDMDGKVKAIKEKADGIKDAIKDELGITDEDIENAMANLGLITTDLLDPDNIKDLMLELTGEQDPLTLVTNEELFTSINDITALVRETVDELSGQLGMTPEELKSLINEQHILSTAAEQAPVQEEADDDEDVKDGVIVEINRTGEPDQDIAADKTSPERLSLERKASQVLTDRKQENEMQQAMAGDQARTEQITAEPTGEVPVTTTVSYADTENILRQVTDRIRVDIGTDSTSMELQLHPASLGTVNLQIASSNGVITANILVQNESVKAALESQMVRLLQTFEEQGQKVEAIEVSVAGYDLDRSLSGEGRNEGNDRQSEKTGGIGRSSRRRLNLNELDEEDLEDLTSEEQLAAEMMSLNGGSVDYMA